MGRLSLEVRDLDCEVTVVVKPNTPPVLLRNFAKLEIPQFSEPKEYNLKGNPGYSS